MERMIVYALTEREMFDLELLEKGLSDVKQKGFDSIHFEWRNTSCTFSHPRMQKAIRDFNRIARGMGLEVLTHANPIAIQSKAISDDLPELFTNPIEAVCSKLIDGEFTIASRGEKLHCAIEKCYLVEKTSDFNLSKCTDITGQVKEISSLTEGGGCKMTKATALADTLTTYLVDGYDFGEVIAIVRYFYVYEGADLSNKLIMNCNSDILEMLSDMDTDGYVWDEPHFGFAFCTNNGRQISDNMYIKFAKIFQYELKDNLVSLWYDVEGTDSSLIRLHYAELMETALSELEMDFYNKAITQLAKKGIEGVISSHRTMHEETSDDFYIGCVDYFRHNKATSGGFSDSVFEREDSMIAMMQMASSLAMDNVKKAAYNMSWGFKPSIELNDYYASLLSAMNVRWNAHAYHGSVLFGPGYPNHPVWNSIQNDLIEHKNALALLKDATRINDIAVLYTWKSLATYPDNYIHIHRRNILFLSKTLTMMNLQHQFISYEILEDAVIENDEIKTRVGNFKKLVIPWCDFISVKARDKVAQCKKNGIPVLIFGAPAVTYDNGSDAKIDFAALCGIEPISKYAIGMHSLAIDNHLEMPLNMMDNKFELNPHSAQENYDSNSDDSYADCIYYYTLKINPGCYNIAEINNDIVGVRSGSVCYYSTEIPYFAKAIEFIFKDSPSIKSIENLMLFEYKTPHGMALSGVSRWNKPLSGKFNWNGKEIALKNCKMFVIRIDGSYEPQIYSTGDTICK